MYEKIKDLCDKEGISIRQLEKSTGLKDKCLDNIRRGNIPNINTVKAVAEHFDVSVDYLVGKSNASNINEIDQQFLVEYKKLTEEKKEHLRQYMQFLAAQEKEGKDNA